MASDNPLQFFGIAGTNGAGKDFIGDLLAKRYGYLFISMTDMLRDELARRGQAPSREHMRDLSAAWRRESGFGVLIDKAVAAYTEAGGNAKFHGLAAASLRHPGEADRLHELHGTLLWVDADPRVRYERIQANRESRGAVRSVDDQKTFEQFLADEAVEMQHAGDAATLSMADVKAAADIVIVNDGNDQEAFARQVVAALGLA